MKTKQLEKMFHYINRHLFDDMLDLPVFTMMSQKMAKRIYKFDINGVCFTQKKKYFWIGLHKELTKTELFDTMVHELIHIDLITRQQYSGHGKPFKKMCRKAIDTFYWRML